MIICSAILMLAMGTVGKIGVLLASIPSPIIGGMYMVMFGIVTAVGISNLRVKLCFICNLSVGVDWFSLPGEPNFGLL